MSVGAPNADDSEKGAALLTVLLLVAVIAILASHGIDRLAGATKLASNSRDLAQANAYLIAAESVGARAAEQIVSAFPGRVTNIGDWNGRAQTFPVPGGTLTATLSDGGNCFNVNGLVAGEAGQLRADTDGGQQLVRLLALLGVGAGEAQPIAASVTDWIDSDDAPSRGGAEDRFYTGGETPYRTANALITDISELRAVKGVTPDIYERIAPWLCALPVAEPAPLNINTLRPERAELFAILSPRPVDPAAARQFFARRPATGYASLVDFWKQPFPAGLAVAEHVQNDVKLTTRWFDLDLTADSGAVVVRETALVDAARQPARLVTRRRATGF